jgi:hypothetical protein
MSVELMDGGRKMTLEVVYFYVDQIAYAHSEGV